MYILGIDTATSNGGVALGRNQEVVGLWMSATPLGYSERLIGWVDNLLREHGLAIADIDCMAVATGPGSFTGIRVGLATAKGLAQALKKPTVGISTLQALAFRYRWAGRRIAPMIDARRQQVFAALYRFQGFEPVEERAPVVQRPAQWLRSLDREATIFVGDGALFYNETVQALRPTDRLVASDNTLVDDLCRLAYHRYAKGQSCSAEQLRAFYVRPSDAELGKGKGG